jgi:hypothetical protein
MMQGVFELRGKKEAARIVASTLAAIEGKDGDLRGAGARAFDPRLDDLLAPETVSPALRALLARTGDALDAAAPLDARALRAAPLPPSSGGVAALASQLAGVNVQVLVSAQLGTKCLPVSSAQPTIAIGDALVDSPLANARAFLIARAVKLVQSRAGALARTPAAELAVLVGAWLHAFNPSWKPQGVEPAALADAARRVGAALPRNLDADVGIIALEVAGGLGTQAATFGAHALAWANHAALLAIGDATAALDAIALSHGEREGAPRDPAARTAWIVRVAEAKELIAFTVTDAYAEARAAAGV